MSYNGPDRREGNPRQQVVDLSGIETMLKTNTENTEKIFKLLNGNGGIGLKTQVELNKQSIGRSWWFLGAISLSILGAAAFIIRGALV